jgi:hypothetical protein
MVVLAGAIRRQAVKDLRRKSMHALGDHFPDRARGM